MYKKENHKNKNKMKYSRIRDYKLINIVDDGFNYFLDYRLEELKSDDKYYIESFMDYIEYLEIRVDRLSKQLKTK